MYILCVGGRGFCVCVCVRERICVGVERTPPWIPLCFSDKRGAQIL